MKDHRVFLENRFSLMVSWPASCPGETAMTSTRAVSVLQDGLTQGVAERAGLNTLFEVLFSNNFIFPPEGIVAMEL